MHMLKGIALPILLSLLTSLMLDRASSFLSQNRGTSLSPPRGTILYSSNSEDPASALTTALARLDQQWKLQQKGKSQSRWTKIVIDDDKVDSVSVEQPVQAASSDFVYLLEPPNNTRPSCLIVFIGGAGLGQFPQIAYNEFLTRVSNNLNAAVIAAPYSIGLDHFSISKKEAKGIAERPVGYSITVF